MDLPTNKLPDRSAFLNRENKHYYELFSVNLDKVGKVFNEDCYITVWRHLVELETTRL